MALYLSLASLRVRVYFSTTDFLSDGLPRGLRPEHDPVI
jgi:hypothetical protein